MRKHKSPHRQSRGPRATLPAAGPQTPGPPCGPNLYPEISGDPWWTHNHNLCGCWHQHDECPCDLVAHVPAHPAADCPC